MTDYNDYNTRLNYIAAKPYIRPELSFDRDIPERDEHHVNKNLRCYFDFLYYLIQISPTRLLIPLNKTLH